MEAGAMGQGGEIFIFDMGASVKIVDLAHKMIKLSGLQLGKDIQLKFTGLRPGEKLYEELLNDQENTLPTYHPKIMIARVRSYELPRVKSDIAHLVSLLTEGNPLEIVKHMKTIVPEFRSSHSVFGQLDD
jgi:FlaA1/EpsC-like NDP-sugar epimerase